MLALAALGFAMVVCPLAGGRLGRLTSAHLRGESALLALFVVQAAARGPVVRFYGVLGLALWGFVSLALLLLMLSQVDRPGLGVAAAGIGLNALVVLSNGGMPAGGSTYADSSALASSILASGGFYEPVTAATHLAWLGDVIPTMGGFASLGDILLVIGVVVFLLDLALETEDAE